MTFCRRYSLLLLTFALQLMLVACTGSGEQQDQFQEEMTQQGEFQQQEGEFYQEGQQEFADGNDMNNNENFENVDINNVNEDELAALENEVENLQDLANNDVGDEDLQSILNEVNNEGNAALVNDMQQTDDLFVNQEEPMIENVVQNDMGQEVVDVSMNTDAQTMTDANGFEDLTAQTYSSGSTVAGNLPEMGTKMGYIVERGDTLGTIAGKIYNNMSRWKELAQNSQLANPNKIFPGDLVYYTLDKSSQAFASNYENQARSMVTVRSGDTLRTIAKRVYGTSQAWKSLWRQNDSVNHPDRLQAGTPLYFIQAGQMSVQVDVQMKPVVAKKFVQQSKQIVLKNLKKSLQAPLS